MDFLFCSVSNSTHKLSLLFCILICCGAPGLSLAYPPTRKLAALVPPTPLVLNYHNGPLLSSPAYINIYILWYGNFTTSQKTIISDFFYSFDLRDPNKPSVASWWGTTQLYKDSAKQGVSKLVKPRGQASDALYSLGKNLKRSDITHAVRRALARRSFPSDSRGIYIVLTADDVYVERFCMSSCGFHDSTPVSKTGRRVVLAWVGNSGIQCPGYCAWPFAAPLYGPPTPPLLPPNGDVGVDGMIINIAAVVAGAATNPFNTGYYQGDALVPMEGVSACAGVYGKGAYPGYPGDLMVDNKSKGSYNTYGVREREFLLPSMWHPSKRSCATL